MADDVTLARGAAMGDKENRRKVTLLASKLVTDKSSQFCKEFCGDNRRQYKCTLDPQWGSQDSGSLLCDRGNDSVVWMLDDLTNNNRLNKFEGKNNAKLSHYLTTIAHSFPFKERWKDWRFGRRIRVPEYIKLIDENAGKIFWAMCDGDSPSNIAQRLGLSQADIEKITKKINVELAKRKKTYLLNLPRFDSMSGVEANDEGDMDLPSDSIPLENQLHYEQVNTALSELSWEERFVFDVLVVDGLSAKAVLKALVVQGVSLKDGMAPEDMTVEDVNYFYKKAKKRLRAKCENGGQRGFN